MSQAVFISMTLWIDNCSEFLKPDIKKRVDCINYELSIEKILDIGYLSCKHMKCIVPCTTSQNLLRKVHGLTV